MTGISPEKEELLSRYLREQDKQKSFIEKSFIPWEPKAKAFAEQKDFFRDASLTKLLKAGNRAAKTFSTSRDVAWKLMRNHPYRKKWRSKKYIDSAPKKFWFIGPTFEFLDETVWKEYLSRFIPAWYYTNDETGELMIEKGKSGNSEYVEKVYFKNGDVLEFKTYSQNILALMGRKIDCAVLDEMPPHLKVISEIVTRCLDNDGEMTMGFTPLNPDEKIKNYLEKHERLSRHSWSVQSNPLYRDNPEKMQRLVDEWKHLPDAERNARMIGEWYYEEKGERVFKNIRPIVVDDFDVPEHWRQTRWCDPASHRSGYAIFAENPDTLEWFCIKAGEVEWKEQLAKAEDIVKEIDKFKPFPAFVYLEQKYDNAAGWFGAYADGWKPCIQKNRELAVMAARDAIVNGKVKFFKKGAAPAVRQIYKYQTKSDGKIRKTDDHIVDCVMYFCREIPKPDKKRKAVKSQEEYLVQQHMAKMQKEWKDNSLKTEVKHDKRHTRLGTLIRKRGLR